MSGEIVRRGDYLAVWLNNLAKKALKALQTRNAVVGVFLLGDREMRRLKYKFSGKRVKSVDVLAFPEPKNFPHPETRGRYLGDIYLNQDLGDERERLAFLLIHGLLHLLGFSHNRKRDILKMERKEQKLLKQLSVIE